MTAIALSEHTSDLLFLTYLSTTLRATRSRVAVAIDSEEAGHYPRLEGLMRDIDAALVSIEAIGEGRL